MSKATIAFTGSAEYWDQRYASGGDSGKGSTGLLANYKAKFINDFTRLNDVKSVLEYGVGDGSQLARAEYPKYVGVDVSQTAIEICRARFKADKTKKFHLISAVDKPKAQLVLSIDVVYVLVEDDIYEAHLRALFESSNKYVIIYSSNTSSRPAPHVRHRRFLPWIEEHITSHVLLGTFENTASAWGHDNDDSSATSPSEFFVFAKRGQTAVMPPNDLPEDADDEA